MKKLLGIVVLGLLLITSSQADDIRDFEIEGISIGDSLLDYMTKKEIKSSRRNYAKNKKYYVVGYEENLNIYDSVDIYLKSGDNKYIVRSLTGTIFMKTKECLIKKKEIVEELRDMFSNATERTYDNVSHSYDKSGKSKQHQTGFLLKSKNDDDHIRVECTDWSKKFENENNWQDNLGVGAVSKEILMWFESGYK